MFNSDEWQKSFDSDKPSVWVKPGPLGSPPERHELHDDYDDDQKSSKMKELLEIVEKKGGFQKCADSRSKVLCCEGKLAFC